MNLSQKAAIGSGLAGIVVMSGFCLNSGRRIALEGVAIGLMVAVWSISSLAILVYALMRDRPPPAKGAQKTMLTAILKLPITMIGLYLGARLPQPGLGYFLAALGLVYCCTVWFLASASHERPA